MSPGRFVDSGCIFPRENFSEICPESFQYPCCPVVHVSFDCLFFKTPESYRFWGRPPRSYRFWGRPQEVIGFGDLWGPSGTIWGPSGDHHSKKLSIFSHFSSKYVIFSQNCTFQIYDVIFPKRFRLKPHINQKNLKKIFQKNAVPNRFY